MSKTNIKKEKRTGIVYTTEATPTWKALVPVLLEVYKHGDLMKQEDIRGEFLRMAEAADQYSVIVPTLKSASCCNNGGEA